MLASELKFIEEDFITRLPSAVNLTNVCFRLCPLSINTIQLSPVPLPIVTAMASPQALGKKQEMLLAACQKGQMNIVKTLVESNVDVNGNVDVNAKRPTGWTTRPGGVHYVGAFLKLTIQDYIDREIPLMRAAMKGHTDICAFLLENKAAVDIRAGDGETALMKAAQNGHSATCKVLIDHGADVDDIDQDGEPVLLYAAHSSDVATMKLLLDEKADIEARGFSGKTPLWRAAGAGHAQVCRLLMSRKADVNAQYNGGASSLMMASQNGHLDVCRLLLEHNAAIEAKDINGWTCLHVAARQGHLNICKLLVASKADISVMTPAEHADNSVPKDSSKTALDLAQMNGQFHIVAFLSASLPRRQALADGAVAAALFYTHGICTYCGEKGAKLKLCGTCKEATYCDQVRVRPWVGCNILVHGLV